VSLAATSDGTIGVASRGDKRLRLWDEQTWSADSSFPLRGGVSAGASDDRGTRFVVGGRDGTLALFRRGRSRPVWTATHAHRGSIDRVGVSPRAVYVASVSSGEGTVRVWDASSGEKTREIAGTAFAFASDDLLVTPEAVHSLSRGKVVARIGGVAPVAASADGRFVYVGSKEGPGDVWYVPAVFAR
jgi:WD40 repeat protein